MLDLTLPISSSTTAFPGDPPVEIEPVQRLARGDSANVSRYCLGSHNGTHIDPPCHFIPGAATIDQIPLDALAGPALVVDLQHLARDVSASDLAAAGISSTTTRLLLQTRNSRLWDNLEAPFTPNYVALAEDGARWLVERGIRLVGIDYLSIESYKASGHPVHRILLSAGIVVVEGLDLRKASPGVHHLVVLPLKVEGGDGGPARAVLL